MMRFLVLTMALFIGIAVDALSSAIAQVSQYPFCIKAWITQAGAGVRSTPFNRARPQRRGRRRSVSQIPGIEPTLTRRHPASPTGPLWGRTIRFRSAPRRSSATQLKRRNGRCLYRRAVIER